MLKANFNKKSLMNIVKLTIIIPAYNSEKTISETLKSVVEQDVNEIECLIIDGNSTDRTINIVKDYVNKYSFIKYISETDKGIYDAMNKGIALANGSYLYFMGSDDVFYNKDILQNLFSLECFNITDFIYGNVLFKYNKMEVGEEKAYLKLIKSQENICHQSIFYSRRVFEKLGKYDLKYPIYSDFNMNIRCFRDATISKKYIDSVICIFNEKGTSHFHRSKDTYFIELHEEYVKNYEDPVAMYDTLKQLETRVAELMNSKEYLLGKKIGDVIRKLKGLFKF